MDKKNAEFELCCEFMDIIKNTQGGEITYQFKDGSSVTVLVSFRTRPKIYICKDEEGMTEDTEA